MAIDFHDPANARTYSGRQADGSWRDAVTSLVDPSGAAVVDVGCGGGTYTRAWHELGAGSVTGVDVSAPQLATAADSHHDLPGVRFVLGDAVATGLPAASADVVFKRALVHHVPDLPAVVAEAARLLRSGGALLVQDRTPDDVDQPGSPEHPRGWWFDVFPRLRDVERARRPHPDHLLDVMAAAGFDELRTDTLWETRQVHPGREHYLDEIGWRTGRSILHELSDSELVRLVDELRNRLPGGRLTERDRWTLWRGVRR